MTGRITAMGQRKYSLELRERATRMTLEALADPARAKGAIRRIADELGVHPEALRTWVRQAEIDQGTLPGTTTDEMQRIKELEKEVRELRRANAILRSASACLSRRSVSAHRADLSVYRGQEGGVRGLADPAPRSARLVRGSPRVPTTPVVAGLLVV